MNKTKVSVVIITLNASRTLERCLLSLPRNWEKIIVDSGSTDETEQIAISCEARFYHNPWPGFAKQRTFGAKLTDNEWLLFLDADEWLSPLLNIEIMMLLFESDYLDALEFKRKSIFKDQVINHGDWSNDLVVRAVKKEKMKWRGIEPHPYLEKKGLIVNRCKEYLMHEPYASNIDFQKKIISYAKTSARSVKPQKITPIVAFSFYFRALWRFIRGYILKLGFLDGHAGFIIAKFNANMILLKYHFIKELTYRNNKI